MGEIKAKSNLIYYIKLVLAILIWSGLYHVARPAAQALPPVILAALRYFVAAILLLIILRYKTGKFCHKLTLMQWWLVFLLGALGICIYNLFFFSAEMLISGNLVAILYAFTPCMTTIISAFVFKTKLNLMSKLGIVIALLGSIAVINYATPECGQLWCSNTFHHIGKGEIFGIGATVVFACYSVISRLAAQRKVGGLVMNTYASCIGGILLMLVAAPEFDYAMIINQDLSFWLAFFYIAILATIVAYLWYTDAIINLGVFKTVIFQNTIPLQTVLIGYIFIHESIGKGVLISGIVVLIGVYITNIALNKPKLI